MTYMDRLFLLEQEDAKTRGNPHHDIRGRFADSEDEAAVSSLYISTKKPREFVISKKGSLLKGKKSKIGYDCGRTNRKNKCWPG